MGSETTLPGAGCAGRVAAAIEHPASLFQCLVLTPLAVEFTDWIVPDPVLEPGRDDAVPPLSRPPYRGQRAGRRCYLQRCLIRRLRNVTSLLPAMWRIDPVPEIAPKWLGVEDQSLGLGVSDYVGSKSSS